MLWTDTEEWVPLPWLHLPKVRLPEDPPAQRFVNNSGRDAILQGDLEKQWYMRSMTTMSTLADGEDNQHMNQG